MAGFWLIIVIVLGLGLGYLIASREYGQEVAQRNLRLVIPLFFVIIFVGGPARTFVEKSLGEYGRLSFSILFAVLIISYPLSWLWRRKQVGSLLLDLGRSSSSKPMLWFGLFQGILAAWYSFSLLQLILRGVQAYSTPDDYFSVVVSDLSALLSSCSLAIFFCSTGLSRLQLRANGICYQFQRMSWQRITSYNWERAKPHILTIRFKSRFPLIPGFWSLSIPIARKDDVEHVLSEYLACKSETLDIASNK